MEDGLTNLIKRNKKKKKKNLKKKKKKKKKKVCTIQNNTIHYNIQYNTKKRLK